MLYIHHTTCISPQPNDLIGSLELSALTAGPVDGAYRVVEPAYPGIAPNVLRRMSKAVRMGVGAAASLIREERIDGILIGTGNGGMEESVKFLRQIVDYAEGALAPGHFVQSIPNAIASQIGLSSHNRGYNSTYVHRGLGFEHALIDAVMLIREHEGARYLVGGVDELSGYHYQIELADGWYKTSLIPGRSLYDYDSPGSIAGEGAALFVVSGDPAGALAAVRGLETFDSTDEKVVAKRLSTFLQRHLSVGSWPALLFSGENGDNRALPFYKACEAALDPVNLDRAVNPVNLDPAALHRAVDPAISYPAVPVVRYKHLCGEYATASAFAVWLALQLKPAQQLPQYLLFYNNHKLTQHSFILLERFR